MFHVEHFAMKIAAVLLLLLTVAQAFAAPPTAPVKPSPIRISVPRLPYRKRLLANGLTVFSLVNHASPTIAIQVWYRVGSKDDPPGRSGFAHLFEHLMFKSTKNMPSEMMDRLTEDVGGENNAYTSSDVTVYHETVPSHYAETLLWAEAERMANLNVNEANFKSERDVVKEEYRQSVLAPPYGLLDNAVDIRSWAVHPYKRPTIGNIADLDAATIDDVRAFHTRFYRPDNATVIVVGDFVPAQLDAWIDRYFGRIPKPNGTIPRVTVTEPPRQGEKRFAETGPDVPLPAVAITYLTPNAAAADAPALEIADAILSGGESARFYQSLIYSKQVASEAGTIIDLRADAGLFELRATAASGKTLDAVEKALLTEVEKLRATPPTAAEMARARTHVLTNTLQSRETNEGNAAALGQAAVIVGDPERVNTDVGRYVAVTAADVQRVVRRYLTPQNRVTVRYSRAKGAK